jgi:hypothetical protein
LHACLANAMGALADFVGRQMSVAKRQYGGKDGSLAHFAVDTNRAAVNFDQFLHQGQAYAAPLDRAASSAFDAPEAIEQVRQF